ncbi:MAG: hypothetical protein IJM51_01590 [Clostridia bacterium]|nr:hypothetical protein [Clostridia bacterium]
MDLIHADEQLNELGIVEFVKYDGAVSLDPDVRDNDWEVEILAEDFAGSGFAPGHYLYFPGTEWGGRLETITHISKTHTVRLGGVTWRGMLSRRVIMPAAGQSHLDMRESDIYPVMRSLVAGFGGLFSAPSGNAGLLCGQKFRYQNVLEGMQDMLDPLGLRLVLTLDPDSRLVRLSAAPVADRSAEIEFSGDYDFSYTSTLGEATYNHVVALGRGEQENRLVRHVWLLDDGTMTTDSNASGIPSGADERALVYDYSSAEDEKELIKGAKKQLKEHGAQNAIEISFDSGDINLPLGDRVGLRDRTLGLSDVRTVTGKLLTVSPDGISLSYTAK